MNAPSAHPMSPGTQGEAVLSARNVAKSYGSVHALRGVNFDVHKGEVTTLFGENGAGKSTLMKILAGIVTPTSGEIILDGRPVVFNNASEALEYGISIIHQELSLAPNMNVRDNIFMGRELTTATGVDYATEEKEARRLLEELEEEIDPLTPVEELRLGQQQVVEIARALSKKSRILIMDEPTSALSAAEVEVLFRVIRDLKAKGVSIVYISHHLEEALEITDHAVVLRDGSMTAFAPRRDINLEWIVRHMVGEHFDLGSPPTGYAFGDVALSIENLSVLSKNGEYSVVDRLSLDIRKGEIVCIYGLMGAGRTELMETVAGRLRPSGGRVLLDGQDLDGLTIAQRIGAGLVLTPEDRQRDGLVQTMTVGENLSLASIGTFVRGLFTSPARERALVDRTIRDVTIKTDGGGAAIGSLSGGNQQKVVIGKMLATNPRVVLLDEPSRGIDIGAKAEVFRLLAEGAKKGLAVLFSTSEVSECLSIAHRIIVMHKGKITAEFGADATKEQIMAASGEVDLERDLAHRFKLKVCRVVTDLHVDELPLASLGEAGAAFLSKEIDANRGLRLGLSHGRTLLACVEALPEQKAPDMRVVTLMGGLTRSLGVNPHEVVGRLAGKTGATATVMPVPFMADSVADVAVLASQKAAQAAFDEARQCDLMLVGIGTSVPQAELVTAGMVAPSEMAAIEAAGGVGEMLGHFFDNRGRPVENPLTERILTLPLDALRGRRIVAVAGGGIKVKAIHAVLASGLLSGLITDEHTAREISEIPMSTSPKSKE
jgi:erythritol transport system ATP-binding protein